MKALKQQLIRLGHKNPKLRRHLKPVLASLEKQSSMSVNVKHVETIVGRDWVPRIEKVLSSFDLEHDQNLHVRMKNNKVLLDFHADGKDPDIDLDRLEFELQKSLSGPVVIETVGTDKRSLDIEIYI